MLSGQYLCLGYKIIFRSIECFNCKTMDFNLYHYFSNLRPCVSPKDIPMVSQTLIPVELKFEWELSK